MNEADSPSADTSPATEHARSAYHPDVLREQMLILRREAGSRSKLEAAITDAYDSATSATRQTAERELADTQQKHAAEIAAARQKHEEHKRKVEQWRAGEHAAAAAAGGGGGQRCWWRQQAAAPVTPRPRARLS